MKPDGSKNRPILVYSLKDVMSMFGGIDNPVDKNVKSDKDWVDAYNAQINRTLRGRQVEDLKPIEKRILKMLLQKYINSSLAYILKKHCE